MILNYMAKWSVQKYLPTQVVAFCRQVDLNNTCLLMMVQVGSDFYGKVKGLAVYNEALSESQLMQLTGVTASSIYNNFVTRTASFTVEALNEVKKVIDNL